MRISDWSSDVCSSDLVQALHQAGIPEPGAAVQGRRPATVADEQALYDVAPSFAELLPWVEFLPQSKSMLLEDGQSVAAFYELVPLGTEGREPGWLAHARDRSEEHTSELQSLMRI